MAKKKRRGVNRGGRPRVRSGDEVQVTVEFPLKDYATLAGWVEWRKAQARANRTSIAAESKKEILLRLWRKHWDRLSPSEQRAARATPAYKRSMQRRAK